MNNEPAVKKTLEIAIRLVLVALLLWYSFSILSPFITSLLWGIIMAVSLSPLFNFIRQKTKWSNKTTATIITVLVFLSIFIPIYFISNLVIDEVTSLTTLFKGEEISIPSPDVSIQNIPVVGKIIFSKWNEAHNNIDVFLETYKTSIENIGSWTLGFFMDMGSSLIHLLLAVFFAGILLAYKEQSTRMAYQLCIRIAGTHGESFNEITENTIMSVMKGVIGVSIIQALLSGLGLYIFNIPYAGILTVLCLILAVVQIGLFPIGIFVVGYSFLYLETWVAISITIWLLAVGILESILKPVLMGSGSKMPMPVIFIGVMGGFIVFGFIGMFVGAIVFTISYKLFIIWLYDIPSPDHKEL
jgi:predicted PurR-regulated permease PerM